MSYFMGVTSVGGNHGRTRCAYVCFRCTGAESVSDDPAALYDSGPRRYRRTRAGGLPAGRDCGTFFAAPSQAVAGSVGRGAGSGNLGSSKAIQASWRAAT
ncbi:MAG: hypothetical protein Kow0054_15370 [Deferrisoma sp.]